MPQTTITGTAPSLTQRMHRWRRQLSLQKLIIIPASRMKNSRRKRLEEEFWTLYSDTACIFYTRDKGLKRKFLKIRPQHSISESARVAQLANKVLRNKMNFVNIYTVYWIKIHYYQRWTLSFYHVIGTICIQCKAGRGKWWLKKEKSSSRLNKCKKKCQSWAKQTFT